MQHASPHLPARIRTAVHITDTGGDSPIWTGDNKVSAKHESVSPVGDAQGRIGSNPVKLEPTRSPAGGCDRAQPLTAMWPR
jgi:hypothetical protein